MCRSGSQRQGPGADRVTLSHWIVGSLRYLATDVNEDKSTRYHRLRRRADLLGTAVAGVVLLGLAILGGGHRLRELAAAITQWAPGGFDDAMNVVVLTILLMLILQIVEFPFAFYQGHLLEHRYGLSTQSTGHWLADQAKGVVLGLVLAVAGTSVVFLALRQSPDHGGGSRPRCSPSRWSASRGSRRSCCCRSSTSSSRSIVPRWSSD